MVLFDIQLEFFFSFSTMEVNGVHQLMVTHIPLNILFYVNWKEVGYTLENAGLFQLKFGSNMDKPKC